MRPIKTPRRSETRDLLHASRAKRLLLPVTALLLISSVRSSFGQIDPTPLLDRSSPRAQTVSKNQLLAPSKAMRAVERARKEIIDGQLESARKDIARALDVAPHLAIAKVLLAAIDVRTENYEAAKALFRGAIEDDPSLGQAYVGMPVVLIHEGRFQTALPLLERAEGFLPSAWFVHFAKAWAELEAGDTEAGLQQADAAERIAGTNSEERSGVSYLRAMVSIHMNDMETGKETAGRGCPARSHRRICLDGKQNA
jgi:tetratricopeptide (TPR) repeat protein